MNIYIAVNKDKKVRMFVSQPHREGNRWVGEYFVNSVVYEQIAPLIEKAGFTFENEPEIIQI